MYNNTNTAINTTTTIYNNHDDKKKSSTSTKSASMKFSYFTWLLPHQHKVIPVKMRSIITAGLLHG